MEKRIRTGITECDLKKAFVFSEWTVCTSCNCTRALEQHKIFKYGMGRYEFMNYADVKRKHKKDQLRERKEKGKGCPEQMSLFT